MYYDMKYHIVECSPSRRMITILSTDIGGGEGYCYLELSPKFSQKKQRMASLWFHLLQKWIIYDILNARETSQEVAITE